MLESPQIVAMVVAGLGGGLLGGLLGIGGSVFFIPVMTELLGAELHTAIATALVVNVCVGCASMIGHVRSGRVMPRVVKVLVPASMVTAVIGVALGWFFQGDMAVWLRRCFGLAMLYIIGFTVYRMFRPLAADDNSPGNVVGPRPSDLAICMVGALKGFVSGLLGIGGGSVAVPAMQAFLRLRLRSAIANSSAALFFSCMVAAVIKHVFLPEGVDHARSWLYVAMLAPTAIVGALAGSHLTHRVGRTWIRGVFVLFIGWVAYRMLMKS